MRNDENTDPRSENEKAETRRNELIRREKENEARQQGLKKGVLTASIIGLLVLVIAGIFVFSHFNREQLALQNQMEAQNISFNNEATSRDSVIGSWLTAFDDIEKNIAIIKEKEHIISINSSNTELSKDRKQQVLEDIKYINTLLEQNKQKIANLNAQLRKSGGSMKILESKISDLETVVKQNENDIAELKTSLVNKKFEVEQLNTQVAVMQDTISRKTEKIVDQTFEMNKAFIASGTYKELRTKGLLTREGGFIGLGKSKSLAGSFPDSSFVQIDITVTKSIAVNSKNAKFITEHNVKSYQLIRDKNKKIESIEITDPAEFWKISRYAVVETKN